MAPNFVLAQGVLDSRRTLVDWKARPAAVLTPWLVGSLAITVWLLLAVWGVASISTPDASGVSMPGLTTEGTLADVLHVLHRNALVLALHAMACVAGFIAGSSLPLEARRYVGVWRRVHDVAGPAAILFVAAATTFSLATQAYVLGGAAATLAAQGGITPGLLLVGLLPHAIPELMALFLPLAAWIVASRKDDWHQLLAATVVTVAMATPTLIVAAFIEVYVSPDAILALRG